MKFKRYYDFFEGVVNLNIEPMTVDMFNASLLRKIYLILRPSKDVSEKGYCVISDDGKAWWITQKQKDEAFEEVPN